MAGHPFALAPAGRPDLYRAALIEALLAKPLKGRPGDIEALYVVHFGDLASPDGYINGGVVVLETERVFGGDSGYYYTGSYRVDAEALQVNATIERHNPTWSVWGDQAPKFDILLTGRRRDGGSVIEGRMRRLDKPGLSLPVMWFRKAGSSIGAPSIQFQGLKP